MQFMEDNYQFVRDFNSAILQDYFVCEHALLKEMREMSKWVVFLIERSWYIERNKSAGKNKFEYQGNITT